MPKVFYSWQSDLPNKTNRSLIRDALDRAHKDIAEATGLNFVVDHDTRGIPGTPHIVDAVFEKIATADIFVADVSSITAECRDTHRPTPNPNVLIEVGYALARVGFERVILVMNTHFGDAEVLPFDLPKHRVLRYLASPLDSNRAHQRALLQKGLADAIKTIVTSNNTDKSTSAPRLADMSVEQISRLVESHVEDASGWRRILAQEQDLLGTHAANWKAPEATKGGNLGASEMLDSFLLPLEPMVVAAVTSCVAGGHPFEDLRDILGPLATTSCGDQTKQGSNLPRAALFVIQNLCGGATLFAKELRRATRIGLMPIKNNLGKYEAIFLQQDLTTSPLLFEQKFLDSRDYLLRLPERMPWLRDCFGNQESFEKSMGAYNLLLCLVDFGAYLKKYGIMMSMMLEINHEGRHHCRVYPIFAHGTTKEFRDKLLDFALPNPRSTRELCSQVGVPEKTMRGTWPSWMKNILYSEVRDRDRSQPWTLHEFDLGELP